MKYFELWRGRLGIIMVASLLAGGMATAYAEDGVAVSNELSYMTNDERKAWQEGLTTQSIKKVPKVKAPDAADADKPVIKTARQELEPGLETHSKKTVMQNCKSDVNQQLKTSPIEFLPGRSTLNAESMGTVKSLAKVLLECATANVIVEGHSDDRGQAATNQRLSGLRAKSVLDALVKLGVKASRLRAIGYGSDKPMVDNDTLENRALNRRIELTLY